MKHKKSAELSATKQGGTSAAPSSASLPARRQAVAILEVLAGMYRPLEAAQLLGTSLMRYYQLERRALEGLVAACEPRPRGPGLNPLRQIATLEREKASLKRECDRQRALVRAAQRALGLTIPGPANSAGKPAQQPAANGPAVRRRPRRPVVARCGRSRSCAWRTQRTLAVRRLLNPQLKAKEVHQIDPREVHDDSIGTEAARRCARQIAGRLGPRQTANDVVPPDARRRVQRPPGLSGTRTESVALLRAPSRLAAASAGTPGTAVAGPACQA